MIIVANPPYSLGNQITSTVLNNVDFKEYVNLMPALRYKKNKIYQHVVPNSIKAVTWTGDASTNPHLAMLTKNRNTNITEADFNTWCYDQKWAKFYSENQKRQHYIIDTHVWGSRCKVVPTTDTAFYITARTVQDGTHKTSNCWDYKWNIEKSLTFDDIPLNSKKVIPGGKIKNIISGGFIYFKTKEEHANFCKFWYTNGGNNLMNSLLKHMGKQSGSPFNAIPRVDWTKEWTDEEILKDYGYTDEEIKDLLFKPQIS